ncbi:3-hydroxybutyryl-CoA dehydrogenase [Pusillimonas sp. CC-YST705]|uniref:L-gulonate 3-dehydrogenase n=1 Tax=Mesopusillimonas faecipullorum TaxID=2755040 RepID=A0ABS8CDL4_9BURK|nr:3-hydroxybutyryl-CoA dehydrogenase [Mesopusillimonas faecipullorum]MCB5364125.1 3-hydroxybutyryl-CoA dehydrogenase [Mesopusillimonas faecipullorum]
MNAVTAKVAALGAGRMGRGIALAYALSGQAVTVIDFKARTDEAWQKLQQEAQAEMLLTLRQLADLDALPAEDVQACLENIQLCRLQEAEPVLAAARLIYEAVPETLEAKRDALGRLGQLAAPDALVASTTSTMLASDLSPMITHPERFMNAHWLNPAYLIPLVEISAHPGTSPDAVKRLRDDLTSIGKVPVECACSPGYIVPRLQTLVMNEAARMVEEGVATAEQIDLATRYGLGFRFAAIGVLEFIDFGGNDILFYASRYLADTLDPARFSAPEIVERYMHDGRNGLRSQQGFHSYENKDLEAYRRDVLARVLAMSRHFGLSRRVSANAAQGV